MLRTKRAIATVSACVILLGCLGASPPALAADPKPSSAAARPNILFCIADDWGVHASAYGDAAVKTPTFDRVAKEGALFKHAFVSSPSCTPSRNAILTGQHFWRLGSGACLWSDWPGDQPTYPILLAKAGYHVGHARKSFGPGKVGNHPHPAGPNYKSLAAFLDKQPKDAPFCFWFGASDPHRPYEPGIGRKNGIDPAAVKLFPFVPDNDITRGDVADYYFEVQRFDREVGDALAELEKRGLLDNTIVVITGDHGMPFPRCKGNLYDCGAQVPLAIRWPKGIPANRTVTDLVSLTDLAPTFLAAAGIDRPAAMTGRNLLPTLTTNPAATLAPPRPIFLGKERHVPCQEAPDTGGTPMRAIRTHDFLYIRNFTPDRWPAGTPHHDKAFIPGAWLADCDNGPTKLYIVDNKDKDAAHRRAYDLCFAKRPAEELYDLKKDPHQMTNLAADPAYAVAKSKLADQLIDELKATKDPRVLGGHEAWDEQPYYGHGPRFQDRAKP